MTNDEVKKGDCCKLSLSSITQEPNTYCICPLPLPKWLIYKWNVTNALGEFNESAVIGVLLFLMILMFSTRERVSESDDLLSVL